MPLFRRVLGAGFDTLPPVVQTLHLRPGRQRYLGEVEVERGNGWLARLGAAVSRLPPAGSGPLRVEIDADVRGERWVRHIGGRAMPSRLWMRDGLLCEQLGPVRFGFRLSVVDAVIDWRVARVSVLGVALPTRWFAAVWARESERGGRYRFDVHAALPWVGLLVYYRGMLDVDDAMSHEADSRDDAGPVIVFDGVCVLCNGWVRFLLKHDRQARYHFAAMQTHAGRVLLVEHGLDADDPTSFLLVEDGRAWTDTDAIGRVVGGLGGAWRMVRIMALLPKRLRDRVYRAIARNRYRWFGTTSCHVPSEDERGRFLQ